LIAERAKRLSDAKHVINCLVPGWQFDGTVRAQVATGKVKSACIDEISNASSLRDAASGEPFERR
jgi:hypothetical protein